MWGAGTPSETTPCSRAGCRLDAAWQVIWRNPRIHGPDRRKTWLACDEHREYLRDYLAARDFPVTVVPFSSSPGEEPVQTVEAAPVADGDR